MIDPCQTGGHEWGPSPTQPNIGFCKKCGCCDYGDNDRHPGNISLTEKQRRALVQPDSLWDQWSWPTRALVVAGILIWFAPAVITTWRLAL